MALDLRQTQKLSQQLVMSMQLQQAIKLLQLSHQELVAAVEKELVENPALEAVPNSSTGDVADGQQKLQDNANAQSNDVVEQNNGSENNDVDWQKLLEQRAQGDSALYQNAAGPSRFEDLPPIEQSLASTTDLAEHLIRQLGMQHCTLDESRAAVALILNLDQRGWLEATWEELAEATGVDMDAVEGAVEIVQGMDPLGCGGRNLAEVLVVQARVAWSEDPFIEQLIMEHLHDFESRNYQGIAKAMELELEDVHEYHKMIQTLEPWPGRPFTDLGNNYITPDIEVVKKGGEWVILQNEDGLPRLRVSNYYQKVLSGSGNKEDKKYIKDKLDAADFLIKSIYKRQRTIYRVMESIIRRQQDFFDHGAERMLPMVLRDVADEIGVHESTVSRVTTNKYVQTPHGIFELKYFFNAGISRAGAEDLAAEAVKTKLKKLVSDENQKKPLSDSALVKLLEKDDIRIARRTVAKYREQLGILPSSKRKQMF